MKKIVVTGAHGFLGSSVSGVLREKGSSVVFFESNKHSLTNPKSMKELLYKADAVVHLAGLNRAEDQDILRVNVLGTHGLLEAISLFSPGARFVFASSFQVYDPNSVYGLSKLFAEKLIERFAKKGFLKGISLRFSNLYGPGAKPFYNSVVATFIHQISSRKEITINGNGLAKRDFLYVTDASEAISSALSCPVGNNFSVLDICTGKTESIRSILALMQRHISKKIIVSYNPEVEDNNWKPRKRDFKKAHALLGWKPQVSLEVGIKNVMESI